MKRLFDNGANMKSRDIYSPSDLLNYQPQWGVFRLMYQSVTGSTSSSYILFGSIMRYNDALLFSGVGITDDNDIFLAGSQDDDASTQFTIERGSNWNGTPLLYLSDLARATN